MNTLPAYGRALTRLGRLDEAETVLQRALNLQAQQGSGEGDVARPDPQRVLYATFGKALEAARAMNRNVVVDGGDLEQWNAALAPRVPDATQALTLLADVYVRKGNADKVLELWSGQFARYVDRREQPDPETRSAFEFEAEIETLHMANALAATGSFEQSRVALHRALAFNASRLGFAGASSDSLDMQIGGFQQRRLLVSALATQSFLAPLQPNQSQALVAAIASSEALASRYAQRRRALLVTDADASFASARTKMADLDRQMMELPQTGEAAMVAWAGWRNAYVAALTPAMAGLNRAGLTQLIGDGTDVLSRVRGRLGAAGWIGFMQYTPVDPATSALGPARYLRYTVTTSRLTVKDLGAGHPVDEAITAWRSAIDGRHADAGVRVAKLLLSDLDSEIQARKEWIIDPDGLVSLLPFEALPDAAGGMVIDAHRLRYATSMAQFADADAGSAARGVSRIIADALYQGTRSAPDASAMRSAAWQRLHDLKFTPLPETRLEAQAVAQALSAMGLRPQLQLGADATPGAFSFTTAPQFLHVATHGFLLTPATDTDSREKHRISVVLPDLLAGLALSPDARGGFLMAQDVAGLNLRGTQLVVLATRDTGNGQVDMGERIASLRRAAEEAGARSTISSLWSVPSGPTVVLMTDFYRHLAAGRSHSEALRLAKLKVLQSGGSVRDWAGFVLAGADR